MRHTPNWRNECGNVTPEVSKCWWSGHILFDTNTGLNNVTVTGSLSCVSVTEAPGNGVTIKTGRVKQYQNKQ